MIAGMLDREEVPAEELDRLAEMIARAHGMGADVARASQRLAVCGGSAGGVADPAASRMRSYASCNVSAPPCAI